MNTKRFPTRVSRAIGTELRRVRNERGLSLRVVAGNLGLSVPYLSDVELGRRPVNAHRLPALASALGVTVEHLARKGGLCLSCCGLGLDVPVKDVA